MNEENEMRAKNYPLSGYMGEVRGTVEELGAKPGRASISGEWLQVVD